MTELNYKPEEQKQENKQEDKTYIDKNGKLLPKLGLIYECRNCLKRFVSYVENTDDISLDKIIARHKCYYRTPTDKRLEYEMRQIGVGYLVSYEVITDDFKEKKENEKNNEK